MLCYTLNTILLLLLLSGGEQEEEEDGEPAQLALLTHDIGSNT
jgi:hypothetical protein